MPSVAEFLQRFASFKAQKDKSEAAAQAAKLAVLLVEAGKRYKNTLAADTAAGRTPRACPKKGSSDKFTLDDFAGALARLPAVEQSQPFDAAFFTFMDKRHPCTLV